MRTAILLLAVVLSVFASVASAQWPPRTTSSSSGKCETFYVRGRIINPNDWSTVNDEFNMVVGGPNHTAPTHTNTSVFWNIDLCSSARFTVAPPSDYPSYGYLVATPQKGNGFAATGFDKLEGTRFEMRSMIFVYSINGSDTDMLAHVFVHCNMSAKTLRPARNEFRVDKVNTSLGERTFVFLELETDQLCDAYTTAAPPPPTTVAPTPAPPQHACPMFRHGDREVNPNAFGALLDSFRFPGYNDTTKFLDIDLCNVKRFTQAPGPSQPAGTAQYGYIVTPPLTPDMKVGLTFDSRSKIEMIGDIAVRFEYASSLSSGDRAHVYVFCGKSPKLAQREDIVSFYSNEYGGKTYLFYLQTDMMCAAPPPAPTTGCHKVTVPGGGVINPGSFGPALSSLKNIETGESVTWAVDPCDAKHWSSKIPKPRQHFTKDGYVIVNPMGTSKDFPTISFDIFDSMEYLSFARELRIRYKTSNKNHSSDEVLVAVNCGTLPQLTFNTKYFFPRRSATGGKTYFFPMLTSKACPKSPFTTSAAPMTTRPHVSTTARPTETHHESTTMAPTHDHHTTMAPTHDHHTTMQPTHDHHTTMAPTHDHHTTMQPTHDHHTTMQPTHDHHTTMAPTHDHHTTMAPTATPVTHPVDPTHPPSPTTMPPSVPPQPTVPTFGILEKLKKH